MRRVLFDAEGATLVGEARTAREAINAALRDVPDIVLMDFDLPGLTWAVTLREVLDRSPGSKVVLMSLDEEDARAIEAVQLGACGYLSKHVDLAALPRIIRGVAAGEAVLSRRLTMRLVERLREAPQTGIGSRPVRSLLTTREWEVLDALCAGASTSAIAEALQLSNETVRSHVKSILRKLEVHTREEAVALAPRLRRASARSFTLDAHAAVTKLPFRP
jgi:DNA-binding NarL/FixJ family response regulator